MTAPLGVLAIAAIVAGVMNLPFTSDLHFLDHWLEPTLVHPAHLTSSASVKWMLAIVAVAGGLVGIGAAVAVYLQGRFPASKIASEPSKRSAPPANCPSDPYSASTSMMATCSSRSSWR